MVKIKEGVPGDINKGWVEVKENDTRYIGKLTIISLDASLEDVIPNYTTVIKTKLAIKEIEEGVYEIEFF